jgi:molecular chaperone HscB
MASVETILCWRCNNDFPAAALCPSCEAIQLLPPHIDYFGILGVARQPVLDEKVLSTRYYDLSRRLHPDLYQTGTAQEQEASLKNTALLNKAYRILRDPAQRGVYWLELHGEKLGKDNNRVPPQLASLVFSIQEQLEELRESRSAGKEADVQKALGQLKAELEEQRTQMQNALMENFAKWEMREVESAAGGTAQNSALLADLKRIRSEMAYLRTLLRDVEKENDVPWNV